MLDVEINHLRIIRVGLVGVFIGVEVMSTRFDIVPLKWRTVHHFSQVGHYVLLVVGVVVHVVLHGINVIVFSVLEAF